MALGDAMKCWQGGPIFQNGPKSPVTSSKVEWSQDCNNFKFRIIFVRYLIKFRIGLSYNCAIFELHTLVRRHRYTFTFLLSWSMTPFPWKWQKVSKWIDVGNCSFLNLGPFQTWDLGLGTWHHLVSSDAIDVRCQSHLYFYSAYGGPYLGTVPVPALDIQFWNWNTHVPKSAPCQFGAPSAGTGWPSAETGLDMILPFTQFQNLVPSSRSGFHTWNPKSALVPFRHQFQNGMSWCRHTY